MNGKTMIDDLPDVEMINRKFISQSHIPPQESGMNMGPKQSYYDQQSQYDTHQGPMMSIPEMLPIQPQVHCVDVASHVKQCPICQYYYNTNTMMYMNIVGLIIIIILILRYHKN